MIHENEIIMLALGVGVYFFVLVNKVHLERISHWPLLLFAYCVLLAGWALTVFKGFFFSQALSFLEHFCYAGSAVALAVWCRRLTRMEGGRGE